MTACYSVHEAFFDSRAIRRSFDHFYRRYIASARETERELFIAFANGFPVLQSALFEEIADQRFQFSAPRKASINVGRERIISLFPWPERFVLAHLANALTPAIEPLLSPAVYSYRRGCSPRTTLQAAARYIREHPGGLYVGRRDVKSYADQLDHAMVWRELQAVSGVTPPILKLVQEASRFESDDRGIPSGTNLSLLIQNLFLREADEQLSAIPGMLYLRYGDDILFCHSDPDIFREGKQALDVIVSARKLEWSQSKSHDLLLSSTPCDDPLALPRCRSFAYLGSLLTSEGLILLTRDKRVRCRSYIEERLRSRHFRLLGPCTTESRLEALCRAAGDLLVRPCGRDGNPILEHFERYINESELRSFDLWLALLVLKLGLGRGFKRSNFKQVPLKRLRELGLPSLVHLRRTGVL